MSAGQDPEATARSLRSGWNEPRPAKLPPPSAWPAGLALAVTLILWGLVSTLIITGVGVALFAIAMTGWVRDIRHERNLH